MNVSHSTVSVKALRHSSVVDFLRKQFAFSLHGEPVSYNWRFVPKGDVWYQFGGEDVYADEDMVEIGALR